MLLGKGAKDVATSTHGRRGAESEGRGGRRAQPGLVLVAPLSGVARVAASAAAGDGRITGAHVYLDELEPVSTFPTTKELELGVKEPTLADVEPPVELPARRQHP